MRTALRFLLAAFRGRALTLEGPQGRCFHVFPDGSVLPAMAGAEDKTPEELAAEEAERKAEEERKAAEAEKKRLEEEEEGQPKPILEGELDKDRAERLIRNERERAEKRLKKAQDAADAAKAEADKLRQERETEQQRIAREHEEEKGRREQAEARATRLAQDGAIRDAAAELDVEPKKVKRLLKLVERDDLEIEDDEVTGATEAVEAVLEEFPEFKVGGGEPPADPPEDPPEPPGGNPDRKRKPKKMTLADVEKLAKEDPDEFNRLMDEGAIPASALGA